MVNVEKFKSPGKTPTEMESIDDNLGMSNPVEAIFEKVMTHWANKGPLPSGIELIKWVRTSYSIFGLKESNELVEHMVDNHYDDLKFMGYKPHEDGLLNTPTREEQEASYN